MDHILFDWLLLTEYEVYQINPAICIQDKVYYEHNPKFDSSLEYERIEKPKEPKPKGIQKLTREIKRLQKQLKNNKSINASIMFLKGYRKKIIEYKP